MRLRRNSRPPRGALPVNPNERKHRAAVPNGAPVNILSLTNRAACGPRPQHLRGVSQMSSDGDIRRELYCACGAPIFEDICGRGS